ncbi:MAG: 50S ribosomal protein L11 methyltransferase [Wenzhouxiangellaceae bacterium]
MPLILVFQVDGQDLEAAERALWDCGAQSITALDAGGRPVLEPGPGETPVWDRVRIEALLPDDCDPDAVALAYLAQGPQPVPGSLRFEQRAEQDWVRAWMDRFQPMRFGHRLWICPSHCQPEPEWPVVVRLDPGLAFGSGTHPTTALCLEWLDGQDLQGRVVLDFGCGSGILAIAALKLGARRAFAIDHDPQALEATRDNARANGVADRITVLSPAQAPDCAADVVVANILAEPLIELAGSIVGSLAPGGRLALSGILVEQAGRVRDRYAERLTPTGQAEQAGWVRLDFQDQRSAAG